MSPGPWTQQIPAAVAPDECAWALPALPPDMARGHVSRRRAAGENRNCAHGGAQPGCSADTTQAVGRARAARAHVHCHMHMAAHASCSALVRVHVLKGGCGLGRAIQGGDLAITGWLITTTRQRRCACRTLKRLNCKLPLGICISPLSIPRR